MIVKQINESTYHIYEEDCIELFITRGVDKWLVHDLLSNQEDPWRLVRFLKKALRWFDENIKEELCADIKDVRFLRLFSKMGFGIKSIHIVRYKNEERYEKA